MKFYKLLSEWQDLTPREQAHEFYSDFYKEIHGVRPRHCGDWSLKDFEDGIENLKRYADATNWKHLKD